MLLFALPDLSSGFCGLVLFKSVLFLNYHAKNNVFSLIEHTLAQGRRNSLLHVYLLSHTQ